MNLTTLNHNTPLVKGAFNPQRRALAMVHSAFSEQLETAGAASSHPESGASVSSRDHMLR